MPRAVLADVWYRLRQSRRCFLCVSVLNPIWRVVGETHSTFKKRDILEQVLYWTLQHVINT